MLVKLKETFDCVNTHGMYRVYIILHMSIILKKENCDVHT